jgi:DNA-binding NtrC family response regulator
MRNDDDAVPTAAARGRVKRVRVEAPQRPAAAEQARGLRIERPHQSTVDVALDEDRRYVIGRHDAADVVLEAAEVSRLHGALSFEGDRWTYQDLGSVNGTTLVQRGLRGGPRGDPRPLDAHEMVALEPGDVLEIGDVACRVELLANAPPAVAIDADVGVSSAARALDDAVEIAARTRLPVFLLGGSGTGKTHTARALHKRSKLAGAFVLVNCARLPADAAALQSELLGHVKGAFTGAVAARVGRVTAADNGTLFLDEVENLSALAQGFLLDVLEGTGDAGPLGAPVGPAQPLRARLVSASKQPLSKSGLRRDLCERLAAGHMLVLPTLAERRSDIPRLVRGFADEQSRLLGVTVVVEEAAMALVIEAPWPGEIRQLRAAVATCAQEALARANGARSVVRREDVDAQLRARAAAFSADAGDGDIAAAAAAVKEGDRRNASPAAAPVTREVMPNPYHLTAVDVRDALARHDNNQSAAARSLGIARNTLRRKMKEFGVDP